MVVRYCKKCGRVAHFYTSEVCDFCKSITLPVPEKYWLDGTDEDFVPLESKKLLLEELVKTSPEFDQQLYEKRLIEDKMIKSILSQVDFSSKSGSAVKTAVECPYCHSTNVKKISGVSKAAHTALFGIFSIGRNSKNFHCNNCKSDF